MKIEILQLIAFGPFTDQELDLSQGHHGLHLVYGPNEAGKSSALRALTQLLFGIPVRSNDNFLHSHPKMRIGGRLRRSDGTSITIVRRKGQSKTLRAADDQTVLPDDALSAFVGTMDAGLFNRLFGIGHEELAQGGDDIVAGGGDVGHALFAAGSGLMQLRAVQERLLREGEELFKPGGSVPAINRGLADLREARKHQKEAVLPAKTWQIHDQALRKAREEVAQVNAQLSRLNQEKSRLSRISAALAPMVRRAELLTELDGCRDVPLLSENFTEERRQLESRLSQAQYQRHQAAETIAKAQAQIESLGVPDQVLAHAEAIEGIQQELGSHLKAAKDRPQLETRMRVLNQEAEARLADIGRCFPDSPAERVQLPRTIADQIQRLGKAHERWSAQLEAVTENRRKLVLRIADLERQQAVLQPAIGGAGLLSGVKEALEAALGAVTLQGRLDEEQSAIEEIAQAVADALHRQALWNGETDELTGLPLVANATIDLFEQQLSGVDNRIAQVKVETAEAHKELARIRTDLQALDMTQQVPTEEDLIAARARRDHGWALVRRHLGPEPPLAGAVQAFVAEVGDGSDLVGAFERSLQFADALSDRLRREADRVHRKASLMALQTQLEERIVALEEISAQAFAERQEVLQRWGDQWASCALTPLTPKEMRAWCTDMRVIQNQLSDLKSRRRRAAVLSDSLQNFIQQLSNALIQAGDAFPSGLCLKDLTRRAKRWVSGQEAAQTRKVALEKEIETRRLELEEIDARVTVIESQAAIWKAQWGQAVAQIGLRSEVDPAEALMVMDSLRAAKSRIDEADVLRQRIAGIDRDGRSFQTAVNDLVRGVAPDLEGQPAHIAAADLNRRLTQACQADSRKKGLVDQRDAAQKELAKADAQLTAGRFGLEALCRQAACATVEELPQIEARAQKRDRAASELREVEKQLRALSAGAALESFADEVAAVDPDHLATGLEALNGRIADLEEERSRLDQTIGTEHNELLRMDGSAKAAQWSEAAEHLLARLESDVDRYARSKIASAILAGAIENYRQKNQGPLIQRAGELLSRMSLGAFGAIRAEFDDQGRPVLVGERPGGTLVTVQGMSDGSADQLYLALRLAGLEQYLQNNESLPFVVDDILMRFDDARALATLQVLAELSCKTQVVFFTHHQHLVELARNAPQVADVLHLHFLA